MRQSIDLVSTDSWLLIGGGALLVDFAEILRASGERFKIAVAPRHLDDNFTFERPEPTLREALVTRGLTFWEMTTIKDLRIENYLREGGVTAVSLDSPWILPKEFIDKFSGRCFNNHGARLPRDRGGGGFSWRILRDDRLGYSVLHQIDCGIDTGGIVKLSEYVYPPCCTIPQDFFCYSHKRDLDLLSELVSEKKNSRSVNLISTPEYLSTYFPRLNTIRHGAIDWNWDVTSIRRFVNAFDYPYPGAFSYLGDTRAHFHRVQTTTDDGLFHPFQCGMVYRASTSAIFIAAKSGSLIVTEVRDMDGQDMTAKIKVGDRFHTPCNILEEARTERAHYSAKGLREELK